MHIADILIINVFVVFSLMRNLSSLFVCPEHSETISYMTDDDVKPNHIYAVSNISTHMMMPLLILSPCVLPRIDCVYFYYDYVDAPLGGF